MGLAAKLAASQAGTGQYGGYAPPAGAPPPQAPPLGQTAFGAHAPPPQAPQPPRTDPTKDVNLILQILEDGVKDQNLSFFYPPNSLRPLAERIVSTGALTKIISSWNLPLEVGMDLARLALFDTVLYLDDSASMSFAENGQRIEELKKIAGKVATAAGLFDADGIEVRWFNSKKEGNHLSTKAQVVELINRVKWDRATPLGTSLEDRVLDPLVHKPAKKGKLKKPVLIVCITDGAPTGEPRDKVIKVIKASKALLSKTPYTADAVSFQLAQVGNDLEAREFLEWIDENKDIGGLVDTTSSFEHEQDNFSKANPPVYLTPEIWLAKLLLGPIHSGYDAADEK
ncbi:hypothetical protein JCM6882_000382 [Rhodosporidiobolus microsporus]